MTRAIPASLGEKVGARPAGPATTESTPLSRDSPTITQDYTLPGTLLGTAGYMSP